MTAVSVIIPVYNAGDSLKTCLSSVLAQDLSDIEVIIVDDGSTDGCTEGIERLSDKIRVINQENAGAGKARNRAIDSACGEYIAFMDADDKYPSPDAVSSLYRAANGSDVCGGSFLIWEKGRLTSEFSGALSGYTFSKDGELSFSEYQFDYGYHRFIYKKSLLDRHSVRFPDYRRYQDPIFMARALHAAGKFTAISKPVYLYRAEPKKIKWTDRQVNDLCLALTEELIFSKANNYSRLHKLLAERIDNDFAEIFINSLSSGNYRLKRLIIDMAHAVSKDIMGLDYVIKPLDDMLSENAGITQKYYDKLHDNDKIKRSMEYRLMKILLRAPRYAYKVFGKKFNDKSF